MVEESVEVGSRLTGLRTFGTEQRRSPAQYGVDLVYRSSLV